MINNLLTLRVSPSAPAINLGPHKDAILDAFFAVFILGGQVGLPIVLLTLLFGGSDGRRRYTLFNFLVSWMLYAIANLLLLYAGESRSKTPSFGVCLTQASFVYGSTVSAGCATFCLVLQLWMELRGTRPVTDTRKCSTFDIQLLMAPWLLFLAIVTLSVLYGVLHPTLVSFRWIFYCTISSNVVVYTVEICTLILLVLTITFTAIAVRKIYQATRQSREVNRSTYHLTMRVTAFTAYSVVTLIMSVILFFIPQLVFPYMFTPTIPLVAFLLFGTQKDHLDIWFGWLLKRIKRNAPLPPIEFKPAVTASFALSTTQSTTISSIEPNSEKSIPLPPIIQEEA